MSGDRDIDTVPTAPELLAAVQAIARSMGWAFAPPRALPPGLSADDAVRALLESAGGRVRRVMLHDGWWTQDHGPLLAFRRQANQPVALLPRWRGGYSLIEMRDDRLLRLPVSPEVASHLLPQAYECYEGLPEGALERADLWKFGHRATRHDRNVFLLLLGLTAAIASVAPLTFGLVVDALVPSGSSRLLAMTAIGLVLVAGAQFALGTVRNLSAARAQLIAQRKVQAAVWDRLLRLPLATFRRFPVGELADRVQSVEEVVRLTAAVRMQLPLGMLSCVLSLGFVMVLQPHMGAWLCGLGLASLVLQWQLARKRLIAQTQGDAVRGGLSALAYQLLLGIVKIRIAAAERRAYARWASGFIREQNGMATERAVERGLDVLGSTTTAVGTAVGMLVCARGGLVTTGSFVAILTAWSTCLMGITMVVAALADRARLRSLWERALPVLSITPESMAHQPQARALRGAIAVRHVTFRYRDDGPTVLESVTFDVAPGEFVAIVGASGSGKSTLMRLLLGFEQPSAGSICWDDCDLRITNPRSIRNQLGVVLQSSALQSGTILENILGGVALSEAEVWRAVRAVGLEGDIQALPMGLHTLIGDGLSQFSGGQRQRMLLARALVREPKALLLDEATSALDNCAQAVVMHTLQTLSVTRIVIAHRLNTIRNADRIVVLDGGRVVQIGNYASLIQAPGVFQRLAKRELLEPSAQRFA